MAPPQISDIDVKAVDTIRILAADATREAGSGHPGAPMGLAPMAHVLWQYYLRFNPKNPKWPNRDRFILSNGHACMLQYALLHLYGYPMSLDDLKHLRQLDSKCPGHPECTDTPGVEVTTGPLGQGISNAVGLAIASANAAATFNKPGFDIIDNRTFVILGDGCMMEGVASEACSLAGHLQLGNLIAFYDSNQISIDGNTKVSFTENVVERFDAYGWHTIEVKNGNTDIKAIFDAVEEGLKVKDKPTLIKIDTIIGFGSQLEGTHNVHGAALKPEDIEGIKVRFGFDPKQKFVVPQDVYDFYDTKAQEGFKLEDTWDALFKKYATKYPKEAQDFERRFDHKLPEGWEQHLPTYKPTDKAVATRKLSEIVLDNICDHLPELMGGSADLTGSNLTRWKDANDFQPPNTKLGTYAGRYIRYGVREHGMGAIMNGIAAYGAHVPFGGTFLNFVSYAAGAVRLSALSELRLIWVATHDSIGLGEDGPTHQPIETLAHFRATPNIAVWRPADGNEVSAAYHAALTSLKTPSILALSRQNLPQLEGSSIEQALNGGYTLVAQDKPHIIIVSSGSEVSIAVEAGKYLKDKQNLDVGIVSLPDWHTFDKQPKEYRLSVLPDGVPIMSFEALSTLGWEKYSHEQFGLNRFGASGPYQEVYAKYHLTTAGVADRALKTYEYWKDVKPLRSPVNKAFINIL